MTKILFTICGRAGSKGVKNKNLKDFCGCPLVYYSLSAIDLAMKKNSEWDFDIVANSDSEALLDLICQNPFLRVEKIVRDESLGGDAVPKIAVIYDCLTKMEEKKNKKYDMIVDLDITSPLRTVNDVVSLLETHIRTGADVTTSVTDSRRNPYFNMVKKTEHGYKKVLESNYTARQQAPEMFDMNASLYAYNPEFLTSGKGVLDGYVECIHMYDTGILDIDHVNDFELMQVIASYLFETNKDFSEIRNNIIEKKY